MQILQKIKLLILSLLCGSCSLRGHDPHSSDPALQKVSKTISLGNYAPADLVVYNGIHVSARIVKDLKRLLAAAKKDGLTLKVVSGYRSYEKQVSVFNGYIQKELKNN